MVYAIEALSNVGPNIGGVLVDRIRGSAIHNLKGQPDREQQLSGIDVLDRYVRALGGFLEIVANFRDEQFKVS